MARRPEPCATSKSGQRVTKFVDFVNGQTTKYDDWGHGTHVAGIIAGNGYDSNGQRAGHRPEGEHHLAEGARRRGQGPHQLHHRGARLGRGQQGVQYNIRVVNMSLGAGVFESYNTDPLTLAAKRAVDAGIVVVAAAGNYGKATNGQTQYGAIGAPGNAPWVLTVGASSTMGTTDRRDDTMAALQLARPDDDRLRAPSPTWSRRAPAPCRSATPNSLFYPTKAAFLVPGKRVRPGPGSAVPHAERHQHGRAGRRGHGGADARRPTRT